MKKLVFMFFLTLLSTSSYAEILKLKCTYKYIDEKFPNYEVGDTVFYDYDLNSKMYVVTDDYIRFYLVSIIDDSHYVHFDEIYRYSGEQISKSAEIPKEEIEELLKLNIYKKQIFEQDEETFYKIRGLTNKVAIKDELEQLPKCYKEIYDHKCKLVYQHVYENYFNPGQNTYV